MLYYTVTHNVSDNGSELAFNTTNNEASLSGSQYGETYLISVYAFNAVGKGLPAYATISGQDTSFIMCCSLSYLFYSYST